MLPNHLFHPDHIIPAAELVPRFDDLSGERESESLVHTDAGGIVGIDARDHGRIASPVRRLQQLLHQPGGDVAPPEVLMHINGMFDAVLVGGPRTKFP